MLLGYLAQRVLGQYDLLVPDDDALGGRRRLLRRRQRPGAREALRVPPARLPAVDRDPRGHAPGAVHRRAVDEALLPVARRRARSSSIDPDPRRIVQALARAADEFRSGRNPLDDGGLVALLASDEQRGALAEVQALMSLLEGHGNSVMNQLGREHVAGQARMARVLQARRQSAGLAAFLHKLRRARVEDAPVRGGRGVRRRGRARGRARARSTPRGAAPSGCRRSTSSAARRRWLARVDGATVAAGVDGGRDRAVSPTLRRARRSRRARPRRSSSGARAVPTRSRCSARGRRRARAGRGARRPRPAARQRSARPTSCADAAARLGAAVPTRVPVDVAPGPQPRGARPRRAVRGARGGAGRARRRPRCSSRTPPTTRPRPCCSTCCAAAARAGLAGMPARRGRVVRPLLGVRRAEHARAVRGARPRAVSTTR